MKEEDKFLKIHPCIRFWKRFKVPNTLEWIEIACIILFFLVIFLKAIHQGLYNNIKHDPNKFLNIGGLETFQYAILSIDYFFIILLSVTIMRYLSKYIDAANKTETILIKFLLKWSLPLTILILVYAMAYALFANISISKDVYGYDNYFISLLSMINMLSRGSMFYEFDLNSFTENVEFTYKVIGQFKIFVFLIFFHIIVKYLVINISIAALLKEYDLLRFEECKAIKISDLKEQEGQ